MGSVKDYFSSLGTGITSLLKGMGVTGKEFLTPKVTESYPDDRKTIQYAAEAAHSASCVSPHVLKMRLSSPTTSSRLYSPVRCSSRNLIICPNRPSRHRLPSPPRLSRLLRLPLSLMSLKSKKKNQI